MRGVTTFSAGLVSAVLVFAAAGPANAQRSPESDQELKDRVLSSATVARERRAALKELANRDAEERAADPETSPPPQDRLLDVVGQTGANPEVRSEALALSLEVAREAPADVQDREKRTEKRREQLRDVQVSILQFLGASEPGLRGAAIDGAGILYKGESRLAPPRRALDELAQIVRQDPIPLLRIRALDLLVEIAPQGYPLGMIVRDATGDSEPRIALRAQRLAEQLRE